MSEFKKCTVCGNTYKYCGHCDEHYKINKWKSHYCSENCRDIFWTCRDYAGKILSIEDAYDKLSKLQINNVGNSVKLTVDEIMSYKPIEITEDEEVVDVDEKPKHRPRKRRPKKIEE